MMAWMEIFVKDSLKYTEMVVLVPSKSLNPETVYYYNKFGPAHYKEVQASELQDQNDTRTHVSTGAPPLTKEEIQRKIDEFEPLCAASREMREVLQKTMNIDQMIAVEVDHCP